MPDLQSWGGSLALACGVVAILRRRHAIGGWLFYFFCQVAIGLALMVISTHWRLYIPRDWGDPARYFSFVVSSLSRMFLLATIGAICILLAETRDAMWVTALQYALATYGLATIVKVAADLFSFDTSAQRDSLSLGFPLVWMAYLAASRRVRRVFFEKSWQ